MVTIEQAINCTTWKTCTKCDEEKKEVFFSISKGKRKAQCKECDAKAYRAKKARVIKEIKQPSWFSKLITKLF